MPDAEGAHTRLLASLSQEIDVAAKQFVSELLIHFGDEPHLQNHVVQASKQLCLQQATQESCATEMSSERCSVQGSSCKQIVE